MHDQYPKTKTNNNREEIIRMTSLSNSCETFAEETPLWRCGGWEDEARRLPRLNEEDRQTFFIFYFVGTDEKLLE